MGNAAYNRGSQLLRDQISRDLESKPKKHPSEIALFHAERINDSLRVEIDSLGSALEKAMLYLKIARAERDAMKEQVREQEEHLASYIDLCKSLQAYGDRMRRSWQKASALLRMLPVDLVNEARGRNV